MSKALFITNTDLKRYSVLDGSLDPDKFLQYIEVAQDIHLQRYMGTDLYNKISADIVADTLTGDYLSLVNTYIKPMTIFWALVEYLPFAAYQVANKGVFKHTSENSTSVDKDEIDYLVEKNRNIAQHYSQRFIDYMCYNDNLYPEYNSNTNEDMDASRLNSFNGWQISTGKTKPGEYYDNKGKIKYGKY